LLFETFLAPIPRET